MKIVISKPVTKLPPQLELGILIIKKSKPVDLVSPDVGCISVDESISTEDLNRLFHNE